MFHESSCNFFAFIFIDGIWSVFLVLSFITSHLDVLRMNASTVSCCFITFLAVVYLSTAVLVQRKGILLVCASLKLQRMCGNLDLAH